LSWMEGNTRFSYRRRARWISLLPGHSEIHLDRRLYEKRVFPSIQLNRSGTRREELLLQPEILQKTRILRQFLYNMDEIEAMEMVLKQMRATKNNNEFFDMMRRGG